MTPRWKRRVGSALNGLVLLFLLFDVTGKLLRVPQVVQGTMELGYPDGAVRLIGLILLVCVLLYAYPDTAVLGAIVLTGYLGGAVATQLRVGNPPFTHILFPVYVGALIWGSLLLREERLRGWLLTPRSRAQA